MKANFACPLDRVIARRSALVVYRNVEKYGVGSLLRLGRVGSPSWLSCCCGWWLWVVVVRVFVVLILRSSYDIF